MSSEKIYVERIFEVDRFGIYRAGGRQTNLKKLQNTSDKKHGEKILMFKCVCMCVHALCVRVCV